MTLVVSVIGVTLVIFELLGFLGDSDTQAPPVLLVRHISTCVHCKSDTYSPASEEKVTLSQCQPKPRNFEKFHCESNTFITASDEINAQEVQDYLTYRIKKGDFFEGTTFCTVAGIHHEMDHNRQVVPGHTDHTLLQGFFYKVFNGLSNFKNEKSGRTIWKEMNFQKEFIAITCSESQQSREFELSENSKAEHLTLTFYHTYSS